jgi:hypothetical protein
VFVCTAGTVALALKKQSALIAQDCVIALRDTSV